MSRLFVGNFLFLEGRSAGSTSAAMRRFEAELAPVWLSIAATCDEILCPEPIDADFWRRMEGLGVPAVRPLLWQAVDTTRADEIVPWGWTPEIHRLAARMNVPVVAPRQHIIEQVNSRDYAFALCEQIGRALPGSSLVRSLDEISLALSVAEQFGTGWIVKRRFTQAGRGQLRGTGTDLNDQQKGWIARGLKQAGVVVVEPRLEAQCEIGVQWHIPRQGCPELLGITTLLTDSQGTFRGSRAKEIEISTAARENLVSNQSNIVDRLQAAGYFGPVGMDAMLYHRDGTTEVRAVQDINARWTMGRLALGWQHQFGSTGTWWHQQEPPCPSAVPLAPEQIEGVPVRLRTWWERH